MKRCNYILALIQIFIFSIGVSYAQIEKISGIVIGVDQKVVSDATVSVNGILTKTSDKGTFVINKPAQGSIIITVKAVGYQPLTDTIAYTGQKLTIQLYANTTNIDEVVVHGQTETQLAKQQAIRAIVVDTKAAAEQPVTLAELMNRSPGIRIRQSGGLGNQVDVSINGFQGNSVQYFRDGIPLEYLGGGYGINNVPINQLERVEVYKGVIPASMGGDALGGAVNLVTKKSIGTSIDASYEIASFNTHIANLSLYHNKKDSKWFGGVDAFYNYSDNNYNVDVEVVNQNANLESTTVPLFHNAYKHYFTEVYAGIINTNWADELRLSFAAFNIDRESQHPALMTVPYGALTVHNKGFVPSLRYKKNIGKFDIDQFISYGSFNRARIDTINGSFNWFGEFIERVGGTLGESPRPSQSDIDFQNVTNRTHFTYQMNSGNKIEANIVYNDISRIGKDPFGFRFSGTDIDVLSKEATYAKAVAGLSWESKWLNEKLTNQLIGKFFHFSTKGIDAFMANAIDLEDFTTYSNQNWGIGNAIKYQITEHDFIRGSFEFTNRLPRENELFGDNDTRAPNFQLEPERSFNINLGYRYQKEKITAEINSFYRKTDGMIMLVPVQPPFAQYQNLDSIRGYGFDIDITYNVVKNLQLMANASWQDNRMTDVAEGIYKWIEGTRTRNTPYFFANASIVGNFENVISQKDRFKPYLHWNFIREFYLNHIPKDKEPQGFLGLFGSANIPVTSVVPNQHLITFGLNYFFAKTPVSFGLEVKNITDAKLFDYYKVQRPGRSFHLKINYQLSKKS